MKPRRGKGRTRNINPAQDTREHNYINPPEKRNQNPALPTHQRQTRPRRNPTQPHNARPKQKSPTPQKKPDTEDNHNPNPNQKHERAPGETHTRPHKKNTKRHETSAQARNLNQNPNTYKTIRTQPLPEEEIGTDNKHHTTKKMKEGTSETNTRREVEERDTR